MKNYENTLHEFICADSREKKLPKNSIHLVVTSPPYPMIEMWDEIFQQMNHKINVLEAPNEAFSLMHNELKKVYKHAYTALIPGGIMVINIGDATRNIGKFKLYPNAAKTIAICLELGFDVLPQIHWWKPTNSPNKFMGSGMYPVGAYVTLETEHILIFRKPGERNFVIPENKLNRQASAFFQSERNLWFSSIWSNVPGEKQNVSGLGRLRNGAFPIELPYRLINMFSVKGDVVLDPFGGTGTTSISAILAGRNSVAIEIDQSFVEHSNKRLLSLNVQELNKRISQRIVNNKKEVLKKLSNKEKDVKYTHEQYGPIYTQQELKISLPKIKSIWSNKSNVEVEYE